MRIFSTISLSLAFAVCSFAGPINGSEGLNPVRDALLVSSDGGATYSATGNLVGADHIEFLGLSVVSSTGDFNSDTTTSFAGPFILDLTGGFGPNSFTISDAGWGTFLSESLVLNSIIGNTRAIGLTNTDVLLTGFTPGTNQLAGSTSNTASMLITLNQSGGPGNAITASLTLNTPAVTLTDSPEPATLALIGSALLGLGVLRRRRA